MSNFADYRRYVDSRDDRVHKATLFESPRLMLGINCLNPGQAQRVHVHADQDKFYLVEEGEGTFTVGDETRVAGPGVTVWCPAGVEHGVQNRSDERLVLIIGMSPAP